MVSEDSDGLGPDQTPLLVGIDVVLLVSEWLEAASYANRLYLHSRWSKSTFLYQRVCALLMLEKGVTF